MAGSKHLPSHVKLHDRHLESALDIIKRLSAAASLFKTKTIYRECYDSAFTTSVFIQDPASSRILPHAQVVEEGSLLLSSESRNWLGKHEEGKPMNLEPDRSNTLPPAGRSLLSWPVHMKALTSYYSFLARSHCTVYMFAIEFKAGIRH